MHDQLHAFQQREFTCPYCNAEFMVKNADGLRFAKRGECNDSGIEFIIENDQPNKLMQ